MVGDDDWNRALLLLPRHHTSLDGYVRRRTGKFCHPAEIGTRVRLQGGPMRSRFDRSRLVSLVLTVTVELVAGCAQEPPARTPAPMRTNVVADFQIASANARTAWDVIALIHPIALSSGGPATMSPTVYLDNVRLGGVEELRLIEASGLAEIRFLTSSEAGIVYGPAARGAGVIKLTTRVGLR